MEEIKEELFETKTEEKKLEKFSYSKLSTVDTAHGGCTWKYKLVYVDHHFIDAPAIATEFGTLVHLVEELMGRDIQKMMENNLPLQVDYKKFSNIFIDGYTETNQGKDSKEHSKYTPGIKALQEKYPDDWFVKDKNNLTYADKAAYYLSRGIYRLRDYLVVNPDLEIVGLEQEFNLEYGNYLFHGFIDRVFRDKATGQIFIEDIKTYSKPVGESDLKTPLQFVFYTLAAQKIYNTELIQCAYEMPLISCKQTAGSKGYLERGTKKIDKLLSVVEAKEYEPNPSPLCHWCIFSGTYPNQPEEAKGLCPYYSHWTKENKDFSVEYDWMGMENHEAIVEDYKKRHTKPTVIPKTNLTKPLQIADRIYLIRR